MKYGALQAVSSTQRCVVPAGKDGVRNVSVVEAPRADVSCDPGGTAEEARGTRIGGRRSPSWRWLVQTCRFRGIFAVEDFEESWQISMSWECQQWFGARVT